MAPLNKTAFHFSQRTELLDFLLEVSSLISQTLDLDNLLETIGDIIHKVVPGTLVAILLVDEETGHLKLRYGLGHREELLKNLTIPLGEGITGEAAKERRAVMTGDVRSYPNYLPAVDAVRSEIAVPMEASGTLVGVIDVQSTEPDAYGEYDRLVLQLLASRVAYAVENARLFERAERQNEMLQRLAEASQQFSSLLDLDTLLQKVAELLYSYVSYASFNVFLVDEAARVLRHRFSLRYDERVKFDNIPLGRGITSAAYESRDVVNVGDALRDPRFIVTHSDIRSEVAVPLVVNDRVIGVLDLESEDLNHFTNYHVQLLRLLAPQLAISIENARLYEELSQREHVMETDLQAARDLQSFLLPRIPASGRGLEISARLCAARTISGDLYDYLEYESGEVLFAVGDVSGKGAAAALYGAMVSGLFRSLAPGNQSPASILSVLNTALVARKVQARYVTMMLALWCPRQRIFRMANSGGVPPVIIRGGALLEPQLEGVPLGLLPNISYSEMEIQLQRGDLMVFVSDGIPDQTDANDQDYGRDRLVAQILDAQHESAATIADRILSGVEQFAGNGLVFDDQTLIVLRVT